MKPTVTFSTLIGFDALPFALALLPHQFKQLDSSRFSKIRLVVDDLQQPLSSYEKALGTLLGDFPNCEIVSLNNFHRTQKSAIAKHIRDVFVPTRDVRNIPLCGWIAGIEPFETDYHFHTDSDLFFGGTEIGTWIDHAISKFQVNPNIFCLSPHPGPNGALKGQAEAPSVAEGLYLFTTFSSRRFLISQESINKILPLALPKGEATNLLIKNVIKHVIKGGSSYPQWEMLVSNALPQHNLLRCNTFDTDAWSIHIYSEKDRVLRHADELVSKVQDNLIPAAQVGCYDLLLDEWLTSP